MNLLNAVRLLAVAMALFVAHESVGGESHDWKPGLVLNVSEGDTAYVRVFGTTDGTRSPGYSDVMVRLYGIEAPEVALGDAPAQPYAELSRTWLYRRLVDKPVQLRFEGSDGLGRPLVTIIHAGVNLNCEMIEQGWAWWSKKSAPHDERLKLLEQQARADHRGLFADESAVHPSDYRKIRKTVRQPIGGAQK